MLHDLQARLAAALVTGQAEPLAGLMRQGPIPWQHGYAVHQGTFDGFLTEILKAAFPVVCRLVGEPFFRAAARRYIRQEPPRQPHLSTYGGTFPRFLSRFDPAAAVPYLSDVALLEWARLEAYFAADAEPIDPAGLATVPAERTPLLRLTPHPSVRLLDLGHPALAIWTAHQDPSGRVGPVDLAAGPERLLVWRPAETVVAAAIPADRHAFLTATLEGETLAAAADRALAADPGTDLQALLAKLLGSGVFMTWTLAEP